MDKQAMTPEIAGTLDTTDEEFLEQGEKPDARNSKLSRYIKMQNFILIKDIIALDEMRLKFMKQGRDISRSRLLSEAIRALSREVAEGRFELKA